MKILFVAEKEKWGLLKTRSAYAYCPKFTKKCNAKGIIFIDVLVEMEMILNISRIWL